MNARSVLITTLGKQAVSVCSVMKEGKARRLIYSRREAIRACWISPGHWGAAVTVTTPEFIGALTAEICFAKPRIVGSIVYTAGDTVTYAQLAEIVDSQSWVAGCSA